MPVFQVKTISMNGPNAIGAGIGKIAIDNSQNFSAWSATQVSIAATPARSALQPSPQIGPAGFALRRF